MKRHLWLGILLLLGGRLLPAPLQASALFLAGALILRVLWANNRGWTRWWPLCCGFSALIAFAVFEFLGDDSVPIRNISAVLMVAFLVAGPAPALAGFTREFCRSVAAGVDGLKIIREISKRPTKAR